MGMVHTGRMEYGANDHGFLYSARGMPEVFSNPLSYGCIISFFLVYMELFFLFWFGSKKHLKKQSPVVCLIFNTRVAIGDAHLWSSSEHSSCKLATKMGSASPIRRISRLYAWKHGRRIGMSHRCRNNIYYIYIYMLKVSLKWWNSLYFQIVPRMIGCWLECAMWRAWLNYDYQGQLNISLLSTSPCQQSSC